MFLLLILIILRYSFQHKMLFTSGFGASSVTRWQGLSLSLAIYNNDNFPSSIKIAKVSTNVCQIIFKQFRKMFRLLKFCQSGEILPNLVTLGAFLFPWRKMQIIEDYTLCSIGYCMSLATSFLLMILASRTKRRALRKSSKAPTNARPNDLNNR